MVSLVMSLLVIVIAIVSSIIQHLWLGTAIEILLKGLVCPQFVALASFSPFISFCLSTIW